MNTKQINSIVDRAYAALECLNNISMTPYRTRGYEMALEEERGHRRGAPDGHRWPRGASANAAGRFFVVLRVAEALTKYNGTGRHVLEIKDLLHTQPSAIYAASLVANYGAEILTAWKGLDIAQLADLNYVEFVNDGERS